MQRFPHPTDVVCGCGAELENRDGDINNAVVGRFITLYSCTDIKYHKDVIHYTHCGLCGELEKQCNNTWNELIRGIKCHMHEKHEICTNKEYYVFIKETEHAILA